MEPLLKISHGRPPAFPGGNDLRDGAGDGADPRGGGRGHDPDGTLAGIFTERDLMTRVVAQHRDPETTRVGDAMTADPVTISPETTLEQALEVMVANHFRHLPIMDGEAVVGMATVRKVLKHSWTRARKNSSRWSASSPPTASGARERRPPGRHPARCTAKHPSPRGTNRVAGSPGLGWALLRQ